MKALIIICLTGTRSGICHVSTRFIFRRGCEEFITGAAFVGVWIERIKGHVLPGNLGGPRRDLLLNSSKGQRHKKGHERSVVSTLDTPPSSFLCLSRSHPFYSSRER